MADCTARFMARRNAIRRSSCCAIDWAISVASISGLRTSTMLRMRLGLRHLGELLAQLLDVGALLADDQARTSGMDRDAALLVRTLDDHLGDRSLLQLVLQVVADLDVLMQQIAVLAGVAYQRESQVG
jgi:hypothetical protein